MSVNISTPVNTNSNILINNNNSVHSIKNGGSVLVRVIEDKGNGKYLGAVGGAKVNITSKNPLTVGKTFVAQINIKDGIFYISPKTEETIGKNNYELKLMQNAQLNSLLQELGLPQNTFSMNVLQQFKQLSMKFDSGLMKKILTLAVKFGGKEKKVIQLLSMLEKKGISGDESDILALLEIIEKDFEQENNDKNKFDFLNKMNKIWDGWVQLPFELLDVQADKELGKGFIRLLYEQEKKLKKLNVDCSVDDRKYLFACDYENKKLKKILFNVSPCGEEEKMDYIERIKNGLLKSTISGVLVDWCDQTFIEGTASDLEEIYGFKGDA